MWFKKFRRQNFRNSKSASGFLKSHVVQENGKVKDSEWYNRLRLFEITCGSRANLSFGTSNKEKAASGFLKSHVVQVINLFHCFSISIRLRLFEITCGSSF